MWDDLKAKHNEITQMISEYSARIAQGNYLEYDDVFDVAIYLRLLGAHVINLLLDDDSLYLPNELFDINTLISSDCNNRVNPNAIKKITISTRGLRLDSKSCHQNLRFDFCRSICTPL